jgi:hypothetical protein
MRTIFSILGLAGHLTSARPSQQDDTTLVVSVTDCLTAHGVPYAVKGSADWTSLTTPFNLRLQYQPAVVTIPNTADQVSSSVICAAAAGLKAQAKGGGHSYASFSSGGRDGSMVVDMQKFSEITVDQSKSILSSVLPGYFRPGCRRFSPLRQYVDPWRRDLNDMPVIY